VRRPAAGPLPRRAVRLPRLRPPERVRERARGGNAPRERAPPAGLLEPRRARRAVRSRRRSWSGRGAELARGEEPPARRSGGSGARAGARDGKGRGADRRGVGARVCRWSSAPASGRGLSWPAPRTCAGRPEEQTRAVVGRSDREGGLLLPPVPLPPAWGWAWRSRAGSIDHGGRGSHRSSGSWSSTSRSCCGSGPSALGGSTAPCARWSRGCCASSSSAGEVPPQRARRLLLPGAVLLSVVREEATAPLGQVAARAAARSRPAPPRGAHHPAPAAPAVSSSARAPR
jgi:hypothetical protein